MWTNLIRSGTNARREDRPRLFFPIFVNERDEIRIPDMEWNEDARSWTLLESATPDETTVYPRRTLAGKEVEGNWHRGMRE